MSLIRQFAIRNESLYSSFELPNVQIFFVQKISFATFGVSIDDFFKRYAGLGYSLIISDTLNKPLLKCYSVLSTIAQVFEKNEFENFSILIFMPHIPLNHTRVFRYNHTV